MARKELKELVLHFCFPPAGGIEPASVYPPGAAEAVSLFCQA
jgi:hypothetical protein